VRGAGGIEKKIKEQKQETRPNTYKRNQQSVKWILKWVGKNRKKGQQQQLGQHATDVCTYRCVNGKGVIGFSKSSTILYKDLA